jgi:hypothetical protein
MDTEAPTDPYADLGNPGDQAAPAESVEQPSTEETASAGDPLPDETDALPFPEAVDIPPADEDERPNAVRWLVENRSQEDSPIGQLARFLGQRFAEFPLSSSVLEIQSALSDHGASEADMHIVDEAVGAYSKARQESADG